MKTQLFLPVITYPDQTSAVMISNAVALARNIDATLHAVAVDITIPPLNNPWSSMLIDVDKMVREAESTSERHGERLLNIAGNLCASAGVTLERETIAIHQTDASDVICGIACHYDLTLLQSSAPFEALSEAIVFGSGRPVMLFPDQAYSGRIEHVVVAWDGSRAAARALGDAALFIGAASRVSIFYVVDEKPLGEDVGRRVFDALKSRGIEAEAHAIYRQDRPIGDVLQAKAVEFGADLLVMGGFGHSRLREFILGGATRDALDAPLLPILMSH